MARRPDARSCLTAAMTQRVLDSFGPGTCPIATQNASIHHSQAVAELPDPRTSACSLQGLFCLFSATAWLHLPWQGTFVCRALSGRGGVRFGTMADTLLEQTRGGSRYVTSLTILDPGIDRMLTRWHVTVAMHAPRPHRRAEGADGVREGARHRAVALMRSCGVLVTFWFPERLTVSMFVDLDAKIACGRR